MLEKERKTKKIKRGSPTLSFVANVQLPASSFVVIVEPGN